MGIKRDRGRGEVEKRKLESLLDKYISVSVRHGDSAFARKREGGGGLRNCLRVGQPEWLNELWARSP